MTGASTPPDGTAAQRDADASEELARRLKTALALHDAGVAMKRAQLRREDPSASQQALSQRLAAWLQTRPGAPFGDAEGIGRPAHDTR